LIVLIHQGGFRPFLLGFLGMFVCGHGYRIMRFLSLQRYDFV
jgi:hypothetical protein